MTSPYRIEGPAVVSFSGGATSGYMLWHILDAHGGELPPDVVVSFQNTGAEREETLRFVQRCSTEWAVAVVWLEYAAGKPGFRVVDHASASRRCEPFEAMLAAKSYLPNPVARICTTELKIRPLKRYLLSLGWEHWDSVLGIRADEPGRLARMRAPSKDRWERAMPLADAGVTVRDVNEWWQSQPFNLGLAKGHGNCDGCLLKSRATIARFCEAEPDRAEWWARMEEVRGATFRQDRPTYRQMINAGRAQVSLPLVDDEPFVDCYCGED